MPSSRYNASLPAAPLPSTQCPPPPKKNWLKLSSDRQSHTTPPLDSPLPLSAPGASDCTPVYHHASTHSPYTHSPGNALEGARAHSAGRQERPETRSEEVGKAGRSGWSRPPQMDGSPPRGFQLMCRFRTQYVVMWGGGGG